MEIILPFPFVLVVFLSSLSKHYAKVAQAEEETTCSHGAICIRHTDKIPSKIFDPALRTRDSLSCIAHVVSLWCPVY